VESSVNVHIVKFCPQDVCPIAPAHKVTHSKQLDVGFDLVTHRHVSRPEQQKDKTVLFQNICPWSESYLVIAVNYSDSPLCVLFLVIISTVIPRYLLCSRAS
jgi:hypothetical protein